MTKEQGKNIWSGSIIFSTLAGLLLLAISLIGCGKSTSKDILSPEERRWLMENQGRIVVGVETNSAPLVFLDAQGQPTGLAHDHLVLLESKLGVRFQRRNFSNLDGIFEKVRSGEVQVVNAVMETPWRSEFISFTKPFISVPNAIIVRKDRVGPMREEDLRGLKVSLVRGFASTERLIDKARGLVPDLVSDDLTGLLNVSFGHSDAGVFDLATVSYLIQKKGITNLRVAGEADLVMQLAMGTPKNEAKLHQILGKGLAAITEAERQRIRDRWITANDFSIFADRRLWIAVGVFILVLLVVVTTILLWNRALRHQVALRTWELSKSMEALALSKEGLAITLNSIGDAVIATDTAGLITRMNPTAERLTGWSLADALGRSLTEVFRIINAQTRVPSVDPVQAVLTHGEVVGLANHTVLLARDAQEYQIADSAAPIRDGAGQILGVVLVFSDVTEKYRVQAALTEREERYRTFFTHGPDGIVVLDPETSRPLEFNDQACRQLGYTREEFGRLTLADIEAAETGAETSRHIQKVLTEGHDDFETLQRTKQGELRHVHVTAQFIQTQGTSTYHCVWRDITERKRAEDALRLSKGLYTALFDLLPATGVVVTDAEGQIVEANLAAMEILGLSRSETLALTFDSPNWNIIRSDGTSMPVGEYASVRALRELRLVSGVEMGIRRPDGGLRWILTSATPIPIAGLGVSITFSDITERKQAEEALKDANQFSEQIIRSAQEGIIVSDLDFRYQVWNPYMEQLTGLSASEVLGKHPFEVLPFLRETGLAGRLEKVVDGETVGSIEFMYSIPSTGKSGWAIDSRAPLRNTKGEIIGVIGMVWDITESKKAEEESTKLQAQLHQSQKMESLGTLAGGVAHDMNNVLGAILGLASAHIGSQPFGSPLHQALDTICKATERGGKMVKSLLSFARQSPAEERELDMNAILKEQVAFLERTTLAKIRLQMDLETELRPILGDASALSHSFMNLCVNAVEAMPENGTLTLHTRNVDNDWIEVVVEDTGTGMPKEILEKALDPFFTTKAIGKGTGLGLSMVFSTVKAHRGQMAIESEPDKGTRVMLRFPACEKEAQVAAPAVSEATLAPHGSMKVLLVDDDDLIQSSVQAILGVLGHTAVTTAQSGEEALTVLEAGFEPDLVVLDMNMPGLGGIGTLPRLRVLRPAVPVLLATGRVDQTALTLASAYPGVTLLAKPFGLRELQKHLESIGLG